MVPDSTGIIFPRLYGHSPRSEREDFAIICEMVNGSDIPGQKQLGIGLEFTNHESRTTNAQLFLAVIYEAGDFAAEVSAVDNHINKTVLEHKLSGLKSIRQLYLYCFSDGAGPCKTNQSTRFGY